MRGGDRQLGGSPAAPEEDRQPRACPLLAASPGAEPAPPPPQPRATSRQGRGRTGHREHRLPRRGCNSPAPQTRRQCRKVARGRRGEGGGVGGTARQEPRLCQPAAPNAASRIPGELPLPRRRGEAGSEARRGSGHRETAGRRGGRGFGAPALGESVHRGWGGGGSPSPPPPLPALRQQLV